MLGYIYTHTTSPSSFAFPLAAARLYLIHAPAFDISMRDKSGSAHALTNTLLKNIILSLSLFHSFSLAAPTPRVSIFAPAANLNRQRRRRYLSLHRSARNIYRIYEIHTHVAGCATGN